MAPQTATDLKALRLNSGHSIRSLATLLQIDRRTVARMEAGLPVSPAKAKLVADHFGVQVTDLVPPRRAA